MITPDPTPPVPFKHRALHTAALVIESLLATALLLLYLTTVLVSADADKGGGWFMGGNEMYSLRALVLCMAVIAAPVLVFFACRKLQQRSWARLAVGYAFLTGVLVYLAHDEPTFRHPVTMEEISPVFPGAEASYAVLMRYGNHHPLGQSFKAPVFKGRWPFVDGPEKPEAWRKAITSVRPELEANWAGLTTEHAWWAELSAFDRIGDLMPARYDAEIMSFAVVRAISQHGVAIASLQAIDGHGDEAVDTLLPILGVARKLQPYSRSLVRSMISVVIEKMSLNTAAFILDTTPVSAAAKAKLAAALEGGDPERGARQLLATEYALQFGWMSHEKAGNLLSVVQNGSDGRHSWGTGILNLISPLAYNPHITFNQVGDLYADMSDLTAKRELDKFDARWKAYFDKASGVGIKNLFGRYLTMMMIPAYQKVAESYWKCQDLRASLLARVTKP
jgi:uncharacterized membrane protein